MSGTDFKVAIIGGGLVGKAMAVIAAKNGFSTLHVAPEAPPDRRTSALMMPSVAFLKSSGLVPEAEAAGVPLQRIRIIDATGRLLRAPETTFSAKEFGHDAFGWNFANTALNAAFAKAGQELDGLTSHTGSLASARRTDEGWQLSLNDGSHFTVDLLVGADGKQSLVRKCAGIAVRERAYKQSALVCDLELGRPLDGESVEFHYPDGPFTLVPAGGSKANLVWIDRPENLEAARADEQSLLAALAEKSMRAFGPLRTASPTFIFPLSSLSVETAGKNGAALVGEAAHAFPPIGAQGLNLGLRDIADLQTCLKAANPTAYGWADATARAYAAARQPDLARTGTFVDGLFGTLISPHLPAQALRTAGLWGLKTLPPLRKLAIDLGMGR